MQKKNSTTKRTPKKALSLPVFAEPQKLEHGSESWELIERLAKDSLVDGELKQHLALLQLLTYAMHDSDWALTARNAVLAHSGELCDTAADLLVTMAQQQMDRTPGLFKPQRSQVAAEVQQ